MKDTLVKTSRLARLTDALSFYAAVLFLLYLLIFVAAYPKIELVSAIAFEVAIFSFIVIWRWNRSKSVGEQAKKIVMEQVGDQLPVMASSYRIWQQSVIVGWAIICVLMNIDLTALSLAFLGRNEASKSVYVAIPISLSLGLHPAASLETLAGAYVEAHKFAPAHRLFDEVRAIRLATYGPDNDMLVALDTDFGDLYSKEKQYEKAGQCYRDAIALSKKINGITGFGRPLTGLANVMRDEGNLEEARKTYEEALAMRVRLYGSKNWRVAETLSEYILLLQKTDDKKALERAQSQLTAIRDREKEKEEKAPAGNPLASVIICCLSLIVSYFLFGPRGFLTSFAANKLKASTARENKKGPKATAADLKNLVLLLKFQGQHAEAETYQNRLKELDKRKEFIKEPANEQIKE